MNEPWILGISASHNGAACLLRGDEVVVAIQEERLTREKRKRIDGAQPSLAVTYCLASGGITAADLALVVVCPQSYAASQVNDVHLQPQLRTGRHGTAVLYVPHHLAHAASAFATSGFDESAVLVVDGLGSPLEDLRDDERRAVRNPVTDGWESLSLYFGDRSGLIALDKQLTEGGRWLIRNGNGTMPRFRSLGGMYSAVAQQIFGDPMDAGKVMGLAAFGLPAFPESDFLRIDADARIVFYDCVPPRFAHDRRWPEMKTEYETLAASVQNALEAALLAVTRYAREVTGATNLSYAGGVALNSVANERILHESGFDDLHIVPAADDAGAAIGAAYLGYWQIAGRAPTKRIVRDSAGRTFPADEIRAAIDRTPFVTFAVQDDVIETTVDLLCHGKIGGWFQEGSELGPRALGYRSIVCDPRGASTKETLNARVKHREAFRPFAPAILQEMAGDWIDSERFVSPFMLRVCRFRPEAAKRVPAVLHVDGSARPQTVTAESNPRFRALIAAFHRRTGVPMLLNTSFNVMGEPIVETPDDALWCLLATDLDFCVLGDHLVMKSDGYRSVLDLTPRIAARRFTVGLAANGTLSLDLAADAEVTCVVETRWGEIMRRISVPQLSLLMQVDGVRNGHDILRDLADEAPEQAALIAMMATLRRLGVIEFQR